MSWPDAVIRFFSCRHGVMENDELKLYQLVADHRFGHMNHICTFWKSGYVTNKTYCWLKRKVLKNCSTWICTFYSIKRFPNLVPLYRTHLVLYPNEGTLIRGTIHDSTSRVPSTSPCAISRVRHFNQEHIPFNIRRGLETSHLSRKMGNYLPLLWKLRVYPSSKERRNCT